MSSSMSTIRATDAAPAIPLYMAVIELISAMHVEACIFGLAALFYILLRRSRTRLHVPDKVPDTKDIKLETFSSDSPADFSCDQYLTKDRSGPLAVCPGDSSCDIDEQGSGAALCSEGESAFAQASTEGQEELPPDTRTSPSSTDVTDSVPNLHVWESNRKTFSNIAKLFTCDTGEDGWHHNCVEEVTTGLPATTAMRCDVASCIVTRNCQSLRNIANLFKTDSEEHIWERNHQSLQSIAKLFNGDSQECAWARNRQSMQNIANMFKEQSEDDSDDEFKRLYGIRMRGGLKKQSQAASPTGSTSDGGSTFGGDSANSDSDDSDDVVAPLA